MAAKKSIDKRKVLEAAQKHWNKRSYDKALVEYQTLLEADPKDVNVRFKVGECFLRLGKQSEASAAYIKVAQDYTKQGFDAKAVAVYKQVLNLDAKNPDVQVALADLYQRLGLNSEAMVALQTAADVYNKEGKKDKALELLRKMAALDPTNTTSRLKVADLLRTAGRSDDALAEYEEVLNELERQGEVERMVAVGEQVLALDASRADLLARMARAMEERRENEKAKEFAKRACGADPRNVEYFEMLAELYAKLGKDKEKQEAYKEVAKLYRERGDKERAQAILQKHVNMELGVDPNELSASGIDVNELSGSGLKANVDPNELSGSGLGIDPFAPTDIAIGSDPDSVLDFGVGGDLGSTLSDDEMFGDKNDTSMSGALEFVSSGTEAVETEVVAGDPEQVLAEASVYLRYNKHDKAVASLKALLKTESEHRGALEMLGDALLATGEKKEALQVWGKAAALAKAAGDAVVFDILKDRIAGIDPGFAATLNGTLREKASDASTPTSSPAAAAPAPDADFGFGTDDEFGGLDVSIDLDEGVAGDQRQKVSDEMFADDAAVGMDVEIDVAIETPPAPAVRTQAAPIAPPAPSLEDEELAFVEEPQIGTDVAKVSDEDTAGVAVQGDEDLEMANFYFEQEMYSEAKALYAKVLKRSPKQPQALLRMGEIEEALGGRARDGADIDVEVETDTTETVAPSAPAAKTAASGDSLSGIESTAFAPEIEISVDDDFAASLAKETSTHISVDSTPTFAPESAPSKVEAPPPPSAATTQVDFEEVQTPAAEPLPAFDEPLPSFEEPTFKTPAPLAEPAPVLVEPTPEFVEPAAPPVAPPVAAEAAPSETLESFEDLMAEEAPPEPPAEDDEKFDLADALSDALAEDPNATSGARLGDAGFEEVFKAFKKGVSETVSEGDYETHYDLGIAYKEMGLYEDALNEFTISRESAARHDASLHMLGLCSIELGRPENAIAYLGDALLSPKADSALQAALQYDMGRAFEAMDNTVGARACYEACVALDSSFPDVAERLENLNNPQSASDDDSLSGLEPVQEAAGFESFDDLMSEAAEAAPEAEEAVEEEASAETFESFEDVVEEVQESAIEAESAEEVLEDAVALDDESVAEDAQAAEAVLEPEPEPAPPPRPSAAARPKAAPPEAVAPKAADKTDRAAKKKKKISYI